jgi:sugar phosphate isomerase/epimerase
MALLSMNEATTYRWSFEEDVAAYVAADIPGIGVWRQKLSDFGLLKAAEFLAEYPIRVSHLFWAGGFTGSDGRSYRESVDDAREALHAAAELKAPSLVLYSGARAGHTFNHARRLVKSALVELAPLAAEFGVDLVIEPMHPGCAGQWTFLTSLDETLALLSSVNSPRVKMVLDTYHLGHDRAILDRMSEVVPYLALVQLGDAKAPPNGEQNRCRLGQGRLPLAEIINALKALGYNGYYDVELIGEEIEAADYLGLLAHAKQAFADLVENGK